MDNIDVKQIIVDKNAHRVFRSRKWDMDEAYSRLKVVRESKKRLVEDLDICSKNMIPNDCKAIYEEIFDLYEKLENLELKNIKFGE